MDVLTIVKRSPFVVPLACLATAAMVFISEGSYWQAAGTLDALGTSYEGVRHPGVVPQLEERIRLAAERAADGRGLESVEPDG